ncbi:putative ribonuclease H-like domain-containing protein [Tanacetum coccineum]
MNKLVKGNLVRGLPSKLFENDQTCVACQKGKQHRATCKSNTENSISLPLHLLHMDLFGLTFVKSLMKKMYCLVVIDDYSRFTWVFFLATKDETSGILKSFITKIENLVDHKVKVVRCDNGTEFKNREMNQFCEMKGKKEIVQSDNGMSTIRRSQNLLGLHFATLWTKVDEDPKKESECNDQENEDNVNNTNNVNAAGTNEVNVVGGKQALLNFTLDPNMSALEDYSIFDFLNSLQMVKTARQSYAETQKPLLKDEDGEEVDVHMYRSMISSLMYLTSSRPDVMFAVCACAGYQVNLKVSNLHAVKKDF